MRECPEWKPRNASTAVADFPGNHHKFTVRWVREGRGVCVRLLQDNNGFEVARSAHAEEIWTMMLRRLSRSQRPKPRWRAPLLIPTPDYHRPTAARLLSPPENRFRPTGTVKLLFPSTWAFGGTNFVLGDLHPLGFLAASKARAAEDVIGEAEHLVAALGPNEADLTPAEEALSAAKALLAAQEYAKAVRQARRASSLAVSLNERFSAYMAAWTVLQACRQELEGLGFPTAELEDALASADRETVHQVEEAGTLVPNYRGAAELLVRATDSARSLVGQAREASREIFLATLAVEALSDSPTVQVRSWLAVRLERTIEMATREMALGHVADAHRISRETRTRADDALAGMARAWELIDLASVVLEALGAPGPVAAALAKKVEAAREALAQGFLDRTSAELLANRVSGEAASFSRQYSRAQRALEQAELVYHRLQQDGFSSYDVDAALVEARRALESGDWTAVRERLGRALRAFLRLRGDQVSLGRAIAEIDERAILLESFRLPLIPDVREILGRAKAEVLGGRISGAHEDVLLARALMEQATRTGS